MTLFRAVIVLTLGLIAVLVSGEELLLAIVAGAILGYLISDPICKRMKR